MIEYEQKNPVETGKEFIVYNGDCAVTLAEFASESIDLTVTSPPYDNLRDYQGFSFDFVEIARQLYRVTKGGGVVVWIVSDATVKGSETGTSFRQALGFMDAGFNLHDTMIWTKTGGGAIGSPKTYTQNFEYMFVLSKGSPKTVNLIYDVSNASYGKNHRSTGRRKKDGTIKAEKRKTENLYSKRNNWWCLVNSDNHEAMWHPAVFPKKLVRDHIITWSNEGDIVLDPFMGSGTTGIVCAELKRKFIGIEISKEWASRAGERVKTAYSQMHLF